MNQLTIDLVAARVMIRTPETWTTGYYAIDPAGLPIHPSEPLACRFCAFGAAQRVTQCRNLTPATPRYVRVRAALNTSASALFSMHMNEVNEKLGHAAVLSVYDAAIERSRDTDAALLEEVRDIVGRIDSMQDQANSTARGIKDKRLRNLALAMVECLNADMTQEEADEEDWS
jgi:hypothetical protein